MTRSEWVGGRRPGPFTKPASGYLAEAGSGRLLGLWLDSIPRASTPWTEAPPPPLTAGEAVWAEDELGRRAALEEKRKRG